MPSQTFLSLTQQVRIPLCSRRYQINRMIHEFLQCAHIFSGIFRQILPASAAGNIASPARQFLDHRLCLLESAVRRERIKQHTVQTVSRNYRNFIKCSEHIQFGQCDILRLLAPDAVTACNSVKRSNAARSACCCAELSAALPQFFHSRLRPSPSPLQTVPRLRMWNMLS